MLSYWSHGVPCSTRDLIPWKWKYIICMSDKREPNGHFSKPLGNVISTDFHANKVKFNSFLKICLFLYLRFYYGKLPIICYFLLVLHNNNTSANNFMFPVRTKSVKFCESFFFSCRSMEKFRKISYLNYGKRGVGVHMFGVCSR